MGRISSFSLRIEAWRAGWRSGRQDGASLVEYAFLVALIAIVCIAAIFFLGGETSTKVSDVGQSVADS